jgi:nucleotide-binding universal stress UspA family protein
VLKILVVTWDWKDPTPILLMATRLSKTLGAELHLAYVWSLLPRDSPEFLDSTYCRTQEDGAWRTLGNQVETVEAEGGIVVETYLRLGAPDSEAAELGEEVQADIMIIGSRRLGYIKRLFSGDEAERIVRHAPCSVLVVRQDGT